MRGNRTVTTVAVLALAGVTPATLAETGVDKRIGTEYQDVRLVRDVREGPDGAIYLLNDSEHGGLYRVTPVQ